MNSLKEAFSRKNMLKNLNFFGELNLGLILTAVGIVYFKNPNHFAFGGTSGLSILPLRCPFLCRCASGSIPSTFP